MGAGDISSAPTCFFGYNFISRKPIPFFSAGCGLGFALCRLSQCFDLLLTPHPVPCTIPVGFWAQIHAFLKFLKSPWAIAVWGTLDFRGTSRKERREEFFRVGVHCHKLFQILPRLLFFSQAVEKHGQRQQEHGRFLLWIAILQSQSRLLILQRRVAIHQIVAFSQIVVLAEPQHIHPDLDGQPELSAAHQFIHIGTVHPHKRAGFRHQPKFPDAVVLEVSFLWSGLHSYYIPIRKYQKNTCFSPAMT